MIGVSNNVPWREFLLRLTPDHVAIDGRVLWLDSTDFLKGGVIRVVNCYLLTLGVVYAANDEKVYVSKMIGIIRGCRQRMV